MLTLRPPSHYPASPTSPATSRQRSSSTGMKTSQVPLSSTLPSSTASPRSLLSRSPASALSSSVSRSFSLPSTLSLSRRNSPDSLLLSFDSDATLYGWYDDLYERIGSDSAQVVSVVHGAHIAWGGAKRGWEVEGVESLPGGWQDMVGRETGVGLGVGLKGKGSMGPETDEDSENEPMRRGEGATTKNGLQASTGAQGGRTLVRLRQDEEETKRREKERVRSAWLLVKKPGLGSSWTWKKRYVMFADNTLVVKSRMHTTLPAQSQILPLSTLLSVNRSDLKDNCLRLQFSSPPSSNPLSLSHPIPISRVSSRAATKTYYLALPSESDLHSWMDDLYARKGGLSVGGPVAFKHLVHIDTVGATIDAESLAGGGGVGGGATGGDQIWKALAGLQGLDMEEVKRRAEEAKKAAEERRREGEREKEGEKEVVVSDV